MITNLPFEPDTPMEDQCGTCNKCMEACPTGALVQGGQINAQACISFLTQTKGMIPEEFRSKSVTDFMAVIRVKRPVQ